jgi:hypothetical protein
MAFVAAASQPWIFGLSLFRDREAMGMKYRLVAWLEAGADHPHLLPVAARHAGDELAMDDVGAGRAVLTGGGARQQSHRDESDAGHSAHWTSPSRHQCLLGVLRRAASSWEPQDCGKGPRNCIMRQCSIGMT